MSRRIQLLVVGLTAAAALVMVTAPTASAIGGPGPTLDPAEIEWHTGTGMLVQFQLRFRNLSTVDPSEPAVGEVRSQQFGVYLPDMGSIQAFNVPIIEPESFFDVTFEVPLCDLPDACGPGPLGTGISPAGPTPPCTPDDHWDGNIDVLWNGPGGAGQVFKHLGTVQACPGFGNSYTHVVTACAGNAAWAINGVCAGWTVTLVNEDFTPAPNPLPPGWSGFICVSVGANVPLGSVCCFTVSFLCNGLPAVINMCATACECPVPTTPTTWGSIKAFYR